ncbi:MAG: M23 family peptidase, partial [Clostridia bacterium]|nr:M23 family peptidase [Clostridia bacterium]
MFISFKLSRTVIIFCAVIIVISSFAFGFARSVNTSTKNKPQEADKTAEVPEKDFIKWVDFKVTDTAMRKAMKHDVESYEKDVHLDWIELLSVLAAKYGGDFSKFREDDLSALAKRLTEGEKIEDITRDMKYYSYYHEAYEAVLGEYLGEYEIQEKEKDSETVKNVKKYGLKAFSPIARGYGYS